MLRAEGGLEDAERLHAQRPRLAKLPVRLLPHPCQVSERGGDARVPVSERLPPDAQPALAEQQRLVRPPLLSPRVSGEPAPPATALRAPGRAGAGAGAGLELELGEVVEGGGRVGVPPREPRLRGLLEQRARALQVARGAVALAERVARERHQMVASGQRPLVRAQRARLHRRALVARPARLPARR